MVRSVGYSHPPGPPGGHQQAEGPVQSHRRGQGEACCWPAKCKPAFPFIENKQICVPFVTTIISKLLAATLWRSVTSTDSHVVSHATRSSGLEMTATWRNWRGRRRSWPCSSRGWRTRSKPWRGPTGRNWPSWRCDWVCSGEWWRHDSKTAKQIRLDWKLGIV